jgi:DNA-binding IclR family transcriptional regulator
MMSDSIRAVDRALDILMCFTRQTPSLSMTQIADKIGMNKSTVHRLLGTLEKRHFLHRDADSGQYQLGVHMLQMAHLALENNTIRKAATPFMKELASRSQETITLSILDGNEVIFLNVIESPQRVKLAASVGQRMPAFATAAGKAMLSRLDNNQVEKILDQGMQRYTPHTVRTKAALLENIAVARRHGFAISMQEYEDGINAVAAPVLAQDGTLMAAVTVAGPAYRFSREKMLEIGPAIMAIGEAIARQLEMGGG